IRLILLSICFFSGYSASLRLCGELRVFPVGYPRVREPNRKEIDMTTMEVGKKLADLCRQGKFADAMNALYSPNIVSIEAHADPSGSMPQRMEGIKAVRGKAEWWEKNHQVHDVQVDGPWPHGDRFIVR